MDIGYIDAIGCQAITLRIKGSKWIRDDGFVENLDGPRIMTWFWN